MIKTAKIVMIIGVVIAIIVGLIAPFSIKQKIVHTVGVAFWGAIAMGAFTLMDYIIKKKRKGE
ncbi:hypothetical protein CN354_26320 [Bacillus cereus]|nr:hypothetical protein CN354_26320 [Bacillus cereus]